MIKLRGHHLVCLHFYQGEGYSEEFIANLNNLMDRAGRDEKVAVVDISDDVCIRCPYLSDNKCMHKTDSDQVIKQLDDLALQLLNVKAGDHVKWADIRKKVMSTPEHWFSQFCDGCDWKYLCQRIKKNKIAKY